MKYDLTDMISIATLIIAGFAPVILSFIITEGADLAFTAWALMVSCVLCAIYFEIVTLYIQKKNGKRTALGKEVDALRKRVDAIEKRGLGE